ncbi:N-acetyltransferase [Mycolicibacterium chitae]|jgi:predicted GNAT family acetyltransferase|uniref:Putative acetyltransferase n=1 Tax=Mycolicibacterium chitae TaxID=1792 RepID=A0A448IB41_MYCCI|nr:GNAT family N-acetyltransferase [Mycolicibacterium chitae]MCV7108507.1 N-acetyltransferase [Mycolicibacterium chitae]BBZ00739.1 N-acetyltransferase [Mycolicibacterium chitae]VEG49587.1 putative acetyltransferase [Mycolicibacterium chitae]
MTLTDKTGAPVTVTKESDRFTVGVDGKTAGHTAYVERDGRRVFFHTEVSDGFEGRGLATLLIGAALAATRDEDVRIVPVCSMVAAYVDKHPEFAAIADEATPEIRESLPD